MEDPRRYQEPSSRREIPVGFTSSIWSEVREVSLRADKPTKTIAAAAGGAVFLASCASLAGFSGGQVILGIVGSLVGLILSTRM